MRTGVYFHIYIGQSIIHNKGEIRIMKKLVTRLSYFSLLLFLCAGCASVVPLNSDTLIKYDINDDESLGNLMKFQFYISRDIVLTATSKSTSSDIGTTGQASTSISVSKDVKEIFSSTPGVALDIKKTVNGGYLIGIAFEADNDNLLWFYYNPAIEQYTFLNYDRETNETDYGDKRYKVSYDDISGVSASVKRLVTTKRFEKDDYKKLPPILLYEERTKSVETEQRKTLKGRKL